MARGDSTARQAETSGVNYSQNLQGQQNQLYSSLAPTLMQDIAHPVGLNPYEKAQANTAAQESAGGSQAGAVGQGALQAQRTRNAGTADAAIGEGARSASRNLSRAALGTELQDSAMKQQKQHGGQASFVNLQPQIKEVFAIMGSLPDMRIFRDQAELDAYLLARQKTYEP